MRRWVLILVLVTIFAASVAEPLWQGNDSLEVLLRQHRLQPSDWKVCNQIAIEYTRAEQFESAAGFYRKVLTLNPTFVPARKNLGVVLWFANRKREAEKVFRGLLAEIPKDVVPHLYIALALYERRQFAEAKLHFSQAGELAMQNPEVLPMVVDAYLSVGDGTIVSQAIDYSSRTNYADTSTNLAVVFNRHRQYQATIKLLEAKAALDGDGYAALAEAWDKQNQPERAFTILAKAIAAEPDREQGYTMLAAFASAHHNDVYALKIVEQGLARNPRSPVLLLQRGLLTAFAGDRESAQKMFQAANEANPQWSLPLLALGIVELEAGRLEAAVEAFKQAIQVAPNEAQGYYFSALAQSRLAQGDQGEAIRMLRKAIAIDPADTRSRVLLGQLEISGGRVKEGAAELERALRADKKNKRALYQLALAYRKLGQVELSKKYMAEFSMLKQKDDEDQTALVQIMKTVK
jgi:tetratricopeptide (TPR) repeat protein